MYGVLRRRIFCSSFPLSYRLMARLTKNVRVCRKREISALASLSHISILVASPKMRRVRRRDIVCSSFLLSFRSTSRFTKNIRDCGKRAFPFEIPSLVAVEYSLRQKCAKGIFWSTLPRPHRLVARPTKSERGPRQRRFSFELPSLIAAH